MVTVNDKQSLCLNSGALSDALRCSSRVQCVASTMYRAAFGSRGAGSTSGCASSHEAIPNTLVSEPVVPAKPDMDGRPPVHPGGARRLKIG